MENNFTNSFKFFLLFSLFVLVSGNTMAYPSGHRFADEQPNQNIVVDINTSFTVSVEWGEGDWDATEGTMFGYGLSTDGTGWTWVDLPWFEDGSGSNKRCKTSLSISVPGKYYYAYRMKKATNGGTSYSFGSVDWLVNSTTLLATSFIDVGVYTISAGDGKWSTTTIWNKGATPSENDNVAIYHPITLDETGYLKSLVITNSVNFNGSSKTLNFTAGGFFTNSGGTFTPSTSTIAFLGSGAVNGIFNFNNVSLSGGVNFGSSSTINNYLTINNGGYVDTNPPYYAENSTLKYFTGNLYGRGSEWSATSGAGYPFNVWISKTNTILNLGANSGTGIARQCGGDLTVDPNTTFSMSESGAAMTQAVTVIGNINNNGTINLSTEIGGDIKTHGSIIDEGILNDNNRAIFFNGGAVQEISGVGSIPYVRINKSGGRVRLLNNLVCGGPGGGNAIEIEGVASKLDLNGKTLTIGSTGVASTYNSGISTPGYIMGNAGGSIIINGDGNFGTLLFDQTTDGTTNALGNLTINRSTTGAVTIGNRLAIKTNLIVTAGSMVISPGVAVTSTATTTNNAGNTGIILRSDATGTGSFWVENSGVSATVERYINNADWTNWQDGWHFISSPVASQAISPAFTTDPYDFYTWHEASNQWVNFKNTTVAPTWNDVNGSTNFTVGKGYMVAYDEAGTKSFAGTLNVSNVSVSGLVITGTTQTNRSWHLLGNPYSSALTWDNGWTRTNIAGVAKIWNEAGQAYSDLTSSPSSSVIPATNGFMVQVVSGTGSLTIPAGKRVHSSQAFYKSSSEEFPGFKLIASPVDYSSFQESLVLVDANASNDYDLMLDGEFLAGYAPQFYSRITDMNLSTNSLPFIDETTQIPFGFVKNTASDYTIELKESIEGYKVFLKDLKANVDHNLTANPVYAFTSLEGDDANRFLLHFESTLGTDDTEKPEQLSMYYNNGSVYVSGAAGKAELFVRNMLGQVVIQQTVNGDGLQVVNTGNLADGVYVVSLVGSGSTKSQKIVIK